MNFLILGKNRPQIRRQKLLSKISQLSSKVILLKILRTLSGNDVARDTTVQGCGDVVGHCNYAKSRPVIQLKSSCFGAEFGQIRHARGQTPHDSSECPTAAASNLKGYYVLRNNIAVHYSGSRLNGRLRVNRHFSSPLIGRFNMRKC